MGRKCVVPFCRGGYKPSIHEGKLRNKVGVFQFPSDPEILADWIKAIPRKNWQPSVNSGVCENHFIPTDFVLQSQDRNVCRVNKKAGRNLLRKRLVPSAVPSIFPSPRSLMRRLGPKGPLDVSHQNQKMFCIVSGCRLGYGTIGLFPSRIQNFEIPKDTVLRQKWLEAIPNPKNLEDQELRVCSLHFDSEDFMPTQATEAKTFDTLIPDAVPHIFPRFVKVPVVSRTLDYQSHKEENGRNTPAFKLIPSGSYDLKSVKPWKFDFLEQDSEKTFRQWERKLRTFFSLSQGLDEEPIKVETLKLYLSDDALQKLDRLKLSESQSSDINHVLTALKLQAANQSHVLKARIKFNLRVQEYNEPFDQFLVDLLAIAQTCEFCDFCTDNLIRDRILAGHKDSETINKMINLPELNLQQVITFCRSEEGKTLLSDGEEPSYDEAEDITWVEEKRLDRNLSELRFGLEHGESSKTKTDDRVIVAFQENDIANPFIIIPVGNSLESGDAVGLNSKGLANLSPKRTIQSRPLSLEQKINNHDESKEEKGLEDFGVRDRFACYQCSDEFISSTSLLNHTKSVHQTQTVRMRWSTCNLCSETFALTKDLLKHNLEVHKEIRPHKCSLCPAQFNHKGHLRRHFSILHKNIRPFECKFCHKRFGTRECLQTHQGSIHEIRKCTVCEVNFKTRNDLRAHVQEHHKVEKVHLCDSCGKSFSNKSILKGHQKRNHERASKEKPFKCPSCNLDFAHLHILLMHVKKMRRTQCENHLKLTSVNGIDLTTASSNLEVQSLRSHISVAHNQEQNSTCEVCQKSFSTNHKMVLHHRSVHLGLKGYGCPDCSATFGQSILLKRHKRVVHDEAKDSS